jgi:hypothetical protein
VSVRVMLSCDGCRVTVAAVSIPGKVSAELVYAVPLGWIVRRERDETRHYCPACRGVGGAP